MWCELSVGLKSFKIFELHSSVRFGKVIFIIRNKKWQWKKIIITIHAHFIIYSFISVLLFRKEEKLLSLLVSSSFRRVSTSGIRNISVATSSSSWVRQAEFKWGVNMESLRNQHSTAARHSFWNESNVTRLVATEHVRKRYSLRESILLQLSYVTYCSILIKFLSCTCCNQLS